MLQSNGTWLKNKCIILPGTNDARSILHEKGWCLSVIQNLNLQLRIEHNSCMKVTCKPLHLWEAVFPALHYMGWHPMNVPPKLVNEYVQMETLQKQLHLY